MKTTTLISTLAFLWSLNAGAQGVHLSAGNTFSIGFNAVDGCRFTEEPFIGGWGLVTFGNDGLGLGESLRLDLFENSLSDLPTASATFTPATSQTGVSLRSSGSWLDSQGIIQITMLSGSVDVDYATFVVFPSLNTWCSTVVPIPEPSITLLATVCGSVSAAFWIWRQRRTAAPRRNSADR